MKKISNRLIRETSPYLLQHAHNPVDWYPWGNEAFDAAIAADKPILVSIGYATCHWCHVMERESFEDENIAAFMNEHFINIKIDREERPDVDAVYMEAVQAIAGNGGWPLNCFLTPERKPFYGGTYFPPRPMYGRASWGQVLQQLSNAWLTKKETILDQAERLVAVIARNERLFVNADVFDIQLEEVFVPEKAAAIYDTMSRSFDRNHGGFGQAPKFPGTMSLQFLLEYARLSDRPEAAEFAFFSLDKMIMGGIYDQVGGGFARYATDQEWLAPHFEKMLYDNALLVNLLANAYKISHKELYKETIAETLEWVTREMMSPEGGFYAAMDADSEGVEGKFYVWDKAEVESILGGDSELFCDFYDITEKGNWEYTNILRRLQTFEAFAAEREISVAALKLQFDLNRRQLKEVRDKRIWPLLDDKIILSWNALMCSAFANASQALKEDRYGDIAIANLQFIFDKMSLKAGGFCHTYKNGIQKYDAYLDDLSFLIQACLDVYQISFDTQWIEKAKEILVVVRKDFYDKEDGLFFFTALGKGTEPALIVRKKDLFDNALPSGNSVMARNLQRLWILTGDTECRESAILMLKRLLKQAEKYPTSFSMWLSCILAAIYPAKEVAVIGQAYRGISKSILEHFIPFLSIMASPDKQNGYPLLKDREAGDDTEIYVCEQFTCHRPVKMIEEALSLLKT